MNLREDLWLTHRLHSSSFLGIPYRIPNINPKKELLWSLWVARHSEWVWCFRGSC